MATATDTSSASSHVPPTTDAGQTAAPAQTAAAAPTKSGFEAATKYATPLVILILAGVVLATITTNWNAWEGGRIEQVTDDAYIRGDLTPLSTKIVGIVKKVKVSDFQQVHKGDLLVELEDDDFRAQVSQAMAAVEAAKAALESNRRQRELQLAKIDRASAGVDQAKAQIAAAQAGKEAIQADVVRTQAERHRQEALVQTRSTTAQRVEAAVADEQRFLAQEASREADLEQTRTALRSNEIAVETERRSLAVLESQQAQLFADLQARKAALVGAEVNLSYSRITAPNDGTVGERQVRPGQLVSPGTQVLTFIDDTKWVQANYRETQLAHMKVEDPAEIRLDAYPDQVLRGKVIQIAPASGSQFALLPPDNATGNFTKVVQRIPVKIAIEDSSVASKLRPGLSVTVTVRTGS
jgi:membrane fusion protein, multidrug efflux system